MAATIVIWFLIFKSVLAQINGEFWWLNNRVSEYHQMIIPLPKFENLTEFDNDESDKIVFRDDNLLANVEKQSKPFNKVDRLKYSKVEVYDNFQDENKIVWPDKDNGKKDDTISNYYLKDDIEIEQEKKYQQHGNNENLPFIFPDTKNYENISNDTVSNNINNYLSIPVNNTKVNENSLDTVNSYSEIENIDPQSNKVKLDTIKEYFQDEHKIVWPNDIEKKKDVFRNNFPKNDVGKELKRENHPPYNNNKELSFIFPETQTNMFNLKDMPNLNTENTSTKPDTEVTKTKLYTEDFLKYINNNKRSDKTDGNTFLWPSDDTEINRAIFKNNFSINHSTKQLNKNNTLPQKIKIESTFIFPETKHNKDILKDKRTSSTQKTLTILTNTTAVTKNHLDSVIFFNGMTSSDENKNIINNNKSPDNFRDKDQIVFPSHIKNSKVESNLLKDDNPAPQKNQDAFLFHYPEKEIPTSTTHKILSQPRTEAPTMSSDKVSLAYDITTEREEEETRPETICSYIKKYECNQRNGFIYSYELGKSQIQGSIDPELICCVLPLPIVKKEEECKNNQGSVEITKDNPQIFYPDSNTQRHKRSNNEPTNINAALKQRDALLHRKYGIQSKTLNPGSTQTKIVSPDSDEDPYWNIKNPNIESTNKRITQKNDYSDYYNHDYVDELPKPGLVGLYSDHGSKPSIWTFGNQGSYDGSSDYDDVDDTDTSSFGYSTIDPRGGINSKTRKRGKPSKLTANSEEETYDVESQIINFQSNPDFHVMEGFKLLNLVRNKNRVYKQNERKTTKSLDENENKESLVTRPLEMSSENGDHELIEEDQLFKGCGRSVKLTSTKDKGRQIGQTQVGTHPWLVLVVQTENLQNILCYATLVHPRLALTAADCVYGATSAGEISVISGLWDLNHRDVSRRRVPSIHFHPEFIHGSLAHGLAILKWKRPLRLDIQVQPVCLGEQQSGDDCKFFGWGGFDQAIRPRSRWQRATISSCSRIVFANKRPDLPGNAFCATVTTRSTVTGIGGPLICDVDGRQAVAGVAVYRHNSVLMLLPARDWAMAASTLIKGE